MPAIKIGRLAVDTRFKRHRIGTALVALAYQRAVVARNPLGCRLLTVDAYEASESFYAKLGFCRNKAPPEEDTCPSCKKPLNLCPHCALEFNGSTHNTVSMRFDLKTDPLPDWAQLP